MQPIRTKERGSFPYLGVLPLALFALLAFPDTAVALGDHIGVEAAPWLQGLSGEATIDGNTMSGTTVDFKDTLGLDPDNTSKMGRVWLRGLKNSLIIDYSDSARSGSEMISQDITFNDTTYTATENVVTDVSLTLLQAKYRHSFNLKVMEFGFDLGLNVAQVDMRLDGSTTGTSSVNEDVPFPTIGAALIIKPSPGFHIRAEADGLSVNVGGKQVRILDARVQVEQYFAHSFGIFGGYRSFYLDVDANDFGSAETTFQGAYAGLGVKF